MTLTWDDIKSLAATLGSLLVAAGTFFLWLTKMIIHQAIAEADKGIHDKIDAVRDYVDDRFVTKDTFEQLSQRVGESND